MNYTNLINSVYNLKWDPRKQTLKEPPRAVIRGLQNLCMVSNALRESVLHRRSLHFEGILN